MTTPYREVENGVVTDKIVRIDANQEEDKVIAQANAELDPKTSKLKGPFVTCRSRDGELVLAAPKDVDLMDVSPNQIWSVATALIPFLEHDDANRALMGSNMMRQAVPLLKTESPLIGTGMEKRAATDTGDVITRREAPARSPTSTPSASRSTRTSTRCTSSGARTRARSSTRSRSSRSATR